MHRDVNCLNCLNCLTTFGSPVLPPDVRATSRQRRRSCETDASECDDGHARRDDQPTTMVLKDDGRSNADSRQPADAWIAERHWSRRRYPCSRIAVASWPVSVTVAAAMFSATCSGDPEPGMGRICGDLVSSQASTIWRVLTP